MFGQADDLELVGSVENGEGVIDAVRRLRPEVVIMDVRLPGIDGISAVKRIAEAAPEVKTVVFSAYGDKRLLSDAIAGMIPPVLLALTHSPGKALVVLVAYILVQQVEGNVIVPLVMSQTVRIHPAMIAIGVVVVGQLFGVPGLFVAVPILSLIVISVEEFWVKPIEEADRERRREDLELPVPAEEELAEAEEHPLRPAS